MTFLGLIKAAYDALQTRMAAAYTYQSMEHLDERLLKDVGLIRSGNRVVAINSDCADISHQAGKPVTDNLDIMSEKVAMTHTGDLVSLPDSLLATPSFQPKETGG